MFDTVLEFFVVVLLICVIAIAGIAMYSNITNRIDEGYIEAKHFEPVHTTHTMYMLKVGNVTVPNYITTYHKDSWYFSVTNEGKHDTWTVTEDDYNSHEVGDWISKKALTEDYDTPNDQKGGIPNDE